MRLAIALLCLPLAGCPTTGGSPLQNVEGFAVVNTPSGEPAFAAYVRGDTKTGIIYYGANGDAGLRDAATKFRFTLPIEGLEIGRIRYWDREADIREEVDIDPLEMTAVPAWVLGLMTPEEALHLNLTAEIPAPLP